MSPPYNYYSGQIKNPKFLPRTKGVKKVKIQKKKKKKKGKRNL